MVVSMKTFPRREELIAATHTPFHEDGSLNLDAISTQADALLNRGIQTVFICGTTGESASLTVAERKAVTQRWMEVVPGTPMQVIAHVGHMCQQDAIELAASAASSGVQAVAAISPSFFKPANVEDLTTFLEPIAAAAPDLPFYYYDIPVMTNVSLPMVAFLEHAGKRIPNLAGLKYTNGDAMQLQEIVRYGEGQYEIFSGFDEVLLTSLALGVKGAVGSTYNFAAPLYLQLIGAFEQGDLETARRLQAESVKLVRVLVGFGFMAAAKATMELLGVPVGPPRPPLRPLTSDEKKKLEAALHEQGLWSYLQPIPKM